MYINKMGKCVPTMKIILINFIQIITSTILGLTLRLELFSFQAKFKMTIRVERELIYLNLKIEIIQIDHKKIIK